MINHIAALDKASYSMFLVQYVGTQITGNFQVCAHLNTHTHTNKKIKYIV